MELIWNKIDVRIVHASKGYELQEAHILAQMQKFNIPFSFELRGDKTEISDEVRQQYFNMAATYSVGSLSCTLKHLLIYESFLKSPKPYLLVFEDDIFLSKNFNIKLNQILQEIETRSINGCLISLENSCMRFPSYWQSKKGQLLYKARDGRAAGAYLLDKKAVQVMTDLLRKEKCNNVIDWWHNYLAQENLLSIYWAHPTIAEQGSHNGKLSAAISTHRHSWKRQIIWLGHKFFRSYFRRLFNEVRILPS